MREKRIEASRHLPCALEVYPLGALRSLSRWASSSFLFATLKIFP